MGGLIGIHGLGTKLVSVLENYCGELVRIYGSDLRSIILYGEIAEGAVYSKKTDVNLILVLKEVTAPLMQKSLKVIAKGQKKGIIAPLFFTEDYIRTSSDVFPVEFLEMKSYYRVLFGEDIFSSLNLDFKYLRLQCEQQVKSMLIKVRQSYLEAGLTKKGMEAVIHESFRSVVPVLRTVLRLLKSDVPLDREEMITAACMSADVDKNVFLAVHNDAAGDEDIAGCAAITFFDKYLRELTKLSNFIDAMEQ